jgi:hypothetical protein
VNDRPMSMQKRQTLMQRRVADQQHSLGRQHQLYPGCQSSCRTGRRRSASVRNELLAV